MNGRYIRQKRVGLRDPTMTHVEDPFVFQVGHAVRTYWGWEIITDIEEKMFNDPMTRFVVLEPLGGADLDVMLGEPGWHDLRPYDVENFHQSAWRTDGRPLKDVVSIEEARVIYERDMAEHSNDFIP